MASFGFVYILTNKAMPGIYKIGFTDRSPMQRADELSRSTSIPLPFEIVAYGEMEDAQTIEREFHAMYEAERVSFNREFFNFSLDTLIRELCINLKEFSINFTCCSAYYLLEFELDKDIKKETV